MNADTDGARFCINGGASVLANRVALALCAKRFEPQARRYSVGSSVASPHLLRPTEPLRLTVQCPLNLAGANFRALGQFMLPDSQHAPARPPQQSRDQHIAFHVGGKFATLERATGPPRPAFQRR